MFFLGKLLPLLHEFPLDAPSLAQKRDGLKVISKSAGLCGFSQPQSMQIIIVQLGMCLQSPTC